jgi:hypothetical protein
MSLKLITLKTNHTILGDIEQGVDNSIAYTLIKYPVQVVSVPPQGPNETTTIAFSPFVEYAEEFRTGFKIYNDDILMISTPVKELMNQYSKIFGSGIQIATSIPKL